MPPLIYRENGEIEEITSVHDYLLSQNSTLYSTMRSSGGKVLELEMHLDRVKADAQEKQKIKEMLKGLADGRITLVRGGISGFELIYEEMPKITMESCQVEIRKAMRQNVQEKNSQWIKDRKESEDSKSPESNEVILSDDSGYLYEGLSSNFFVIRPDGRLQTAPLTEVLPGTVMKRVLEKWKYSEILFEKARIEDASEWQGAFITSTSRLILPIHTILLDNLKITVPKNEFIEEIKNEFIREIQ